MEEKSVNVNVGVVIMKDGKILLGKRNDDSVKDKSSFGEAGTWTMPGGKMRFGEEFEQAAARELLEETGIIAKRLKVICVNNEKTDDEHFVSVGMLCDMWEGEIQVKEHDKITEWQWFDLESPPFPVYVPSAKILFNLRKGNFYYIN